MKRKMIAGVTCCALWVGFTTNVYATSYTGADIERTGVEYSDILSIDQPGVRDWSSMADSSIWTAWARQWVEYSADLDEGNWNIGLNVTNIYGELGHDWYSAFEIKNSLNSTLVSIPASTTDINYGFINQDLAAGTYTIRYTWLNDKWDGGNGLDANIQITSAFFDNTATEPVPEPATILLFGAGIMGMAAANKRKKK